MGTFDVSDLVTDRGPAEVSGVRVLPSPSYEQIMELAIERLRRLAPAAETAEGGDDGEAEE